MAERLHMLRTWTDGGLVRYGPHSGAAVIRRLTTGDVDVLGRLLWSAFGHEGRDGFASASAALAEGQATLAGKWGPVIWEASLLGVADESPVAAAVIVEDDAHDRQPLVAFLVTDPGHQRRGLGQQLLERALERLDAIGMHELHIAVTSCNRARRLYQRLGFREISS